MKRNNEIGEDLLFKYPYMCALLHIEAGFLKLYSDCGLYIFQDDNLVEGFCKLSLLNDTYKSFTLNILNIICFTEIAMDI